MAATYMPIPKNTAVAREICLVGPEKMTQLVVNTIYMNTVDRKITEYFDPKEGKATMMINPTSRMIHGSRKLLDAFFITTDN
jgi:hypothetical protein